MPRKYTLKRGLASPKSKSPKKFSRKTCNAADWNRLLEDAVNMVDSGQTINQASRKTRIVTATIKSARRRVKKVGKVVTNNKGGRPPFFSTRGITMLQEENESREREHLSVPKQEVKKFLMEQHLNQLALSFGGLANVPVDKILTSIGRDSVNKYRLKVWDRELSNVKTDRYGPKD